MKKQNNRRIALVVVGLLVVACLLVISVVASVFAYRQFSATDEVTLSFESRSFQAENELQTLGGKGVIIVDVDPDSPAAAAGIKQGMVILEVNGSEVNTPGELRQAILEHEVGDKITLTVQEGDEEEKITATLASAGPYLGVDVARSQRMLSSDYFGMRPPFPEDFEEFFPEFSDPGPKGLPHHGFRHGYPGESGEIPAFPEGFRAGVVVLSVEPDSPAEAAGLQSGDVITEINGETVKSRDRVVEMISELNPGQEVTVNALRQGEDITVTVTLASHPEDSERGFLGIFLGPQLPDMEFFFENSSG